MKERYKVLAAIIALADFTVDDIAGATGVKPNTVSTILARERRLLEKIADEKTGRRGGKRKRYRIKPESAEILRSELAELYRNLPVPDNLARLRTAQNEPKPPTIPLGLLAAEDTLLFRYPISAESEEKQRILNLAKLDYRKGLSESRRLLAANPREETRTAVESSLSRVKALQKIFELDLLAHSSATPDRHVSAQELRERLSELSNSVSEAITGLSPVLTSVWQFRTTRRPQSESSLIPEHESYTTARSLLDRASLETDSRERSVLLEQASRALDAVWKDYENRDTHLITIAFIRYEQGRLRFWRRDYQKARMFFTGAKEVFATSEKYGDEITKVDQYLAVLSVEEFRQDQPDAPAELEISTTFSALEAIDSRSQANYPLIKFLQDLLTRTIGNFSEIENELRRQIKELKRKVQPAEAPEEIPLWQTPSLRYAPDAFVYVAAGHHSGVHTTAHERCGVSHEHPCFTLEAVELRRAVDLSAQNSLACLHFDEKGQKRSTYDLSMMMRDG